MTVERMSSDVAGRGQASTQANDRGPQRTTGQVLPQSMKRAARALVSSRWLMGAGVAVAGLGLSLPSPAQASSTNTEVSAEQRFQLGLEAQTAGEYRVMLDEWRAAASGGVVPAQELLAMALLVGPELYGEAVSRDLCESAHWMRRAAVGGSRVGVWQVMFVNRLRQAPGAAICNDWAHND